MNIDAGGFAGGQSIPNRLSDSKGTVIIFNPATQQSLFVPINPKGGSSAWSSIGIDGFNIWGNTSRDNYNRSVLGETDPVVETSLYAFDFDDVQMSSVRNCAVFGFMTGIRERNRCQNNNYENIYIQYCRETAILFSAPTITTEITDSRFTNVRVWACLHAVQMLTAGGVAGSDPLQVRFEGCFFNSLSSNAIIITSAAREIMFLDCYVEGVGLDTGVSGPATFLINGTATAENVPVLNVIGGQYAGATGGITPTNGVFLKTDICGGVNLIAVSAKRYVTGIICTSNTRDKSIYVANPFFDTVSGSLFDASTANKIIGTFRTIRSDGGNNNVVVRSDYFVAETEAAIEAPTIKLGDGSSTAAFPGGNNTMTLGSAINRWSEVFAVNGTINTSDRNQKQDIRQLTSAEAAVAAALKPLLKAYRWQDAVASKGDDARIHFGIIAQDVADAFTVQGLDASNYGMFCSDTWTDRDGNEQTSLGVRYTELLAFIIAAT